MPFVPQAVYPPMAYIRTFQPFPCHYLYWVILLNPNRLLAPNDLLGFKDVKNVLNNSTFYFPHLIFI